MILNGGVGNEQKVNRKTAVEAARCWESNAEVWTQCVRAGWDVYRDALNTPAFLAMLPPVRGLWGLDIGCGEGANTRSLARLGTRMAAIDIAPTFIHHAKAEEEREALGIEYRIADATDLPFDGATFDFATAFMSLMDVPDAGTALGEAARVLKPGGFLQLSILHPCFVPPHRKVLRDMDGAPQAIEIADCFEDTKGRVETWCFSSIPAEERERLTPFQVPRFHRTLSAWVGMIGAAGFAIEQITEPRATEKSACDHPVVADTLIAPMSLLVRVRKPA